MTTRSHSRALFTGASAVTLAFAGTALVGPSAAAAVFTATDEGELIAAINNANVASDTDTITLGGNIVLTADLPDLVHPLEIVGNGHSIDGGGNEVFSDDDASSISDLTFTGVNITNSSLGIGTSYTASVTITDSVFDDAPVDLYGDGGNTIVVQGSNFDNASGEHGLTLSVRDGSAVTISGSSADANGRSGFDMNLTQNSTLVMTNSTADSNTRSGFEVEAQVDSTATISGSSANGNVVSGLTATAELGTTITVSDSTFNGTADGYGVVLNPTNDSTMTLERVSVTGNDSGGIQVNDSGYVGDHSTVTITDSTSDGNTGPGLAVIGSAPDTGATSMDIVVTGTTLSNNSFNGGAGVFAYLFDNSSLTVVNSTISGNNGALDGTVIVYGDNAGNTSFALSHSTIVNNTLSSPGDTGGVLLSSLQYSIVHSILADNTADGVPSDLFLESGLAAPTGTIDYSLVQVSSGDALTAVDAGTGNLKDIPAQLGTLADNGGPTLTHLPLDGSPMIGAGSPAISGAPANDQRGQTRVVGIVDMGAIEIQAALAATGADATSTFVGGSLLLGVGLLLLFERRRRSTR